MKTSETLLMRGGKLASRSNRRLVALASVLALIGFFSCDLAEAQGSSRRLLIEYGYSGVYRGVARGSLAYRPIGGSPFTSERISQVKQFTIPPATNEVITDPLGEGKYRILNKVTVNKRRAKVRGIYFGEAVNERLGNPGKPTTRTGARTMTITRNARQNRIVSMKLDDRIREFDKTSVRVILARWKVGGEFRQ